MAPTATTALGGSTVWLYRSAVTIRNCLWYGATRDWSLTRGSAESLLENNDDRGCAADRGALAVRPAADAERRSGLEHLQLVHVRRGHWGAELATIWRHGTRHACGRSGFDENPVTIAATPTLIDPEAFVVDLLATANVRAGSSTAATRPRGSTWTGAPEQHRGDRRSGRRAALRPVGVRHGSGGSEPFVGRRRAGVDCAAVRCGPHGRRHRRRQEDAAESVRRSGRVLPASEACRWMNQAARPPGGLAARRRARRFACDGGLSAGSALPFSLGARPPLNWTGMKVQVPGSAGAAVRIGGPGPPCAVPAGGAGGKYSPYGLRV